MANPVLENLNSWQPDHTAGDTNAPLASGADPAGIGDSQDLSGNLRLLKSVLRAVAAHMSWEIWLGVKNLAATGNIAFTYSSATVFTVNDDFSATGRNLATVGRRVRATITGSVLYGTITAVSWLTPTTTITVLWDSGTLNSSLSDVQFGPELGAVSQAQYALLTNATGGTLTPGSIVRQHTSTPNAVAYVGEIFTLAPILVAVDTIANGAKGRFQTSGYSAALNVNGATSIGHYLTSTANANVNARDSGVAGVSTAQPPAGAFALSLSSTGGAGQVSALLFGATLPGLVAHAATHLEGGSDALSAGGVIGSRVYRFKEGGGVGTDLSLGSVGNGQFLRRSGANVVGDVVNNTALQTATGSASVSSAVSADVIMNDYAFFPSFTVDTLASGASHSLTVAHVSDPSNTTARIRLARFAGNDNSVVRWRYMTATDNPTLWVAFDNTGAILAVWASDDPTPGDVPGLAIPELTVARFKAADLAGLPFAPNELAQANARIAGGRLSTAHQLYRALQVKGDPAIWLLNNCHVSGGALAMGKR